MLSRYRSLFLAATAGLIVLGCTPAATTSSRSSESGPSAASGPKRITAAIRGMPTIAYQKMNPRSNVIGVSTIQRLINTGLTVAAPEGTARIPRLAEQSPTLENGAWRLLPDGGMETRWTLRDGIRWHDGSPMTTEDLAFSLQVWKDRDFPIFSHVALQTVGDVQAIDSRTIVVRWSQPYIYADRLFGSELVLPVSKAKLGEPYLNDREHFLDHPGWGLEMNGNGPFRIKDWQVGSFVVLERNDQYALGRPKIDEIVVKFIPDPNTLAANILAGEVDIPWGGRLDIEWAMNVANQWQAGKLDSRHSSMLQIFVQHINPTPSVVNQLPFKRAMLMALDRQTMVDTLRFGLTSIGHTFISPQEPEYSHIESSIMKYPYDTRQALQLLEGLGYTRTADGRLVDAAGQQLRFQIRTSQGDTRQEPAMYASADDWSRLGADVERFLVPPQRANDAQFRAEFPAFDVKGQAGTLDYATNFHTRAISLPENNFTASQNNSRYSRPEMDQAVDRTFTTIPFIERMEWAKQIVKYLSEDAAWFGLYYDIAPSLLPNRILNLPVNSEEIQMDAILEWDLR